MPVASHHRLAHRVNTMAGSMRVTFMIAAIAETTHMTTVSTNSADAQPRRDDDRQRARRRHAHHDEADRDTARPKPITALSSAWQMMTL